MNIVLPCQNGICPHITSPFGSSKTRTHHGGVDFNYVGGQSGINLKHPTVYSPVQGTVTFVRQKDGMIQIRDVNNIMHEIFHTKKQFVKKGDKIEQGQKIGTMGNKGAATKHHHVHYQIKTNGTTENPGIWWHNSSSDD